MIDISLNSDWFFLNQVQRVCDDVVVNQCSVNLVCQESFRHFKHVREDWNEKKKVIWSHDTTALVILNLCLNYLLLLLDNNLMLCKGNRCKPSAIKDIQCWEYKNILFSKLHEPSTQCQLNEFLKAVVM